MKFLLHCNVHTKNIFVYCQGSDVWLCYGRDWRMHASDHNAVTPAQCKNCWASAKWKVGMGKTRYQDTGGPSIILIFTIAMHSWVTWGGGKQDTADHFLKLKAWSTVMLSRHKHWYYGSQCNYHEMLLVWRNSEHPRLPKRNRYMYAYYGISSHCHDCVESKLGRILVYIPTDCFIKWNSSLSLHSSCQTRADLYPRQLCSAIL